MILSQDRNLHEEQDCGELLSSRSSPLLIMDLFYPVDKSITAIREDGGTCEGGQGSRPDIPPHGYPVHATDYTHEFRPIPGNHTCADQEYRRIHRQLAQAKGQLFSLIIKIRDIADLVPQIIFN